MGMAGLVEALQQAAKAVTDAIPDDDELADAVGLVRQVERKLQDARLRWERVAQEMEPIPDEDRSVEPKGRAVPVARGKRYELVPQHKTVRSYNTPAIFTAIQNATDWTSWATLRDLMEADALRLTWRWTELNNLLAELRVPLHKGYEEVDDDSGTEAPMVGEVRVATGMKRVEIHPDDLCHVEQPFAEPDDVFGDTETRGT